MANKKYWLKIKENFFDEDEIVFLKSQQNGYEYIYLWQRLLLKCLKVDESEDCGLLRINNKVPYDVNMLSTLFGMNIDIVRIGIELFKKLGLLEILDDGTFYIEAVQKMIGKESESAERVRLHRKRKEQLTLPCNNDVTKCNPILIENKKEEKDNIYIEHFEKFWQAYPRKLGKKGAEKHFKANIKTDTDLSNLKKALSNYLKYIKLTAKEEEYILHGSTFMNNYTDWINYDFTKIETGNPVIQSLLKTEKEREHFINTVTVDDKKYFFERFPHGTFEECDQYTKERKIKLAEVKYATNR